MNLKEIITNSRSTNKAWSVFNLKNGYVTIWKFRALVNELVDKGELSNKFEQPRGIVESRCGK